MPSLKQIVRRLSDRAFGTHFERALERSLLDPRRGYLFFWNRGMGDIALGLEPLIQKIRARRPDARIAVITREELRIPFLLADVGEVYVLPGLEREARVDVKEAAERLGIDYEAFGTVFEYPDPNRWLVGRRQEFPPKLRWNREWDVHAQRLLPATVGKIVIAAHVDSGTQHLYGYAKDWPAAAWQELFLRFGNDLRVHWVLLGYGSEQGYVANSITDLRGKTGVPELLSVIRNRCRILIAPDSGVLTMAYYLDSDFPLDVISLWSDPRQGILLQGCPSPNPSLRHMHLIGEGEDVRKLPVADVAAAVQAAIRNA
jgi:ADP-heptose:LPS heptosyltransferase